MQVATPETTAFDLVRFPAAAGYWSNIATVLSELAEKLDPEPLAARAAACSRHGRTEEVDAIRAPGACGEAADGDAHGAAEKCRRDVPFAAAPLVLFGVRRPGASPGVCGPVESPFRPLGGVSRGGRGAGARPGLAPPPSQRLAYARVNRPKTASAPTG